MTRLRRAKAWIFLWIAVFCMSSGGLWFALLGKASPPIMKACWRLTLTSLLQAPAFVWQARAARRAAAESGDTVWGRWKDAGGLLVLTGGALAAHFATWAASVDLTSLSHSLLFVTTSPIILVGHAQLRHWAAKRHAARAAAAALPQPAGQQEQQQRSRLSSAFSAWADPALAPAPTRIEVVGCGVALLAAVVLAGSAAPSSSSSSSSEGGGGGGEEHPTVLGDFLAFLGALTVAVYLAVGGSLRKWMPLFLYAFPVTAASAALSGLGSLMIEGGTSVTGFGPRALLGWAGDGDRFWLSLGAATFSGLLGHTLANAALSSISPLVVSICILAEPLIGSVMGYLVGVQGRPTIATALAGPLLLLGAALVTVGGRDSPYLERFNAWCEATPGLRWLVARPAAPLAGQLGAAGGAVVAAASVPASSGPVAGLAAATDAGEEGDPYGELVPTPPPSSSSVNAPDVLPGATVPTAPV